MQKSAKHICKGLLLVEDNKLLIADVKLSLRRYEPVLRRWPTCVIADVGRFRSQRLVVLGLDVGVGALCSWLDHGIQGHSNLKAVAKAPAHIP